MAECDGSTLPRRQLGKHLRNGREAIGLTLAEVSELMQWSISTVQRMEVGKTERIRLVDIVALCRIYEFTDEFTEVLKELGVQAAGKSWWHEFGDLMPGHFDVFVDLESTAARLTTYEPEIVPGIVQIPLYARTLIEAVYPDSDPAEIDRRVRLRVERQVKVTRKTRPVELSVVLGEGALRRTVGSGKIMATQHRYLADLSTRPNINIRILPFSAGFPTGAPVGSYVILEPKESSSRRPNDPTVVYVENFTGELYLKKKEALRRYAEAHRILLDAALDEVQSRQMLRSLAKEYLP